MKHELVTTGSPRLYVELQSGDLLVTGGADGRVSVEVTGPDADEVSVEQRDDEVRVVARRRTGFFGFGSDVRVVAEVPAGCQLLTRTGSADVRARADLGPVEVATGSGSVQLGGSTGDVSIKSGSGSVEITDARGDVDVKTGSGDVAIGEATGTVRVGTGSGSVTVTHAAGTASLKSGSGDLTVREAAADLSLSAASGDLRVGRIVRGQADLHNVSGDIRLGIPDGTPVWTDVSSRTGQVRSSLAPVGAPEAGQDHIEVRARSLTGDILLEQVDKEQS